MDELLKMLMEAAKEGKVQVVHLGTEPKTTEPGDNDIYAEAKQEAEHIAKLNKILFDAHVAAGFDEMDALELTCAVIGSTNE